MIRRIACMGGAMICVGVAVTAGCGKKEKTPAKERVTAAAAAVPVIVDTVRAGIMPLTVQATGQVKAWREVDLAAQVEGRVFRAPEREGRRYLTGEVVYEVDPAAYRLAMERARLNVEKARLEYEFEVRQRPNAPESSKEMLKTTTGLKEAELAQAQAELALENAIIRAPFACVVADLTTREGSLVYRGQALCRLLDVSKLRVSLSVGEEEAAAIREGAPCWMSFPALGDTEYAAAVLSVSPSISTETRGCGVDVACAAGTGAKPGMHAKVRVQTGVVEHAVMVPERAILQRSERPMVFVVKGGRAKWEYVELGKKGHGVVQVAKGASPGDIVIVDGHFALAHDTPVEPLASSISPAW